MIPVSDNVSIDDTSSNMTFINNKVSDVTNAIFMTQPVNIISNRPKRCQCVNPAHNRKCNLKTDSLSICHKCVERGHLG